MCREYFVGAVSQLLATHFSPLMTSHPPCNEYRSTDPRRPLSGSMKLLYHIMAVPFLGGITKFAMWQLTLRLNSSVVALGFSSSWVIKINYGRFRRYDFCLRLSCATSMRHDFTTDRVVYISPTTFLRHVWMDQSNDVRYSRTILISKNRTV